MNEQQLFQQMKGLLNDDEDGISETEDIFEMPSFDNEVEIVVMEKQKQQMLAD